MDFLDLTNVNLIEGASAVKRSDLSVRLPMLPGSHGFESCGFYILLTSMN
jgi:hypothetical protein